MAVEQECLALLLEAPEVFDRTSKRRVVFHVYRMRVVVYLIDDFHVSRLAPQTVHLVGGVAIGDELPFLGECAHSNISRLIFIDQCEL